MAAPPVRTIARRYCFTVNNPRILPVPFAEVLKEKYPKLRYLIFQLEVGVEGTPHYQGYVELGAPQRFAVLARLIHGTCQPAIADAESNTKYCSKEDTRAPTDVFIPGLLIGDDGGVRVAGPPTSSGNPPAGGAMGFTGPWSHGNPSRGRGARSDLAAASELATRSRSLRELAINHPLVFIKYHRGLERLIHETTPRGRQPPMVILVYGPPSAGKSRWARSIVNPDDLYVKEPGNKWFDGYFYQKNILLDDFSGADSELKLTQCLRLLDRYAHRVEVKGGSLEIVAERIIISTNNHPLDWYNWENRTPQYWALARRIHQVIVIKEDGVTPRRVDRRWFFGPSKECIGDFTFEEAMSPTEDLTRLCDVHCKWALKEQEGRSLNYVTGVYLDHN